MNSLISASGLAQRLDAPDLIIIDCRFQLQKPDWGQQQYRHQHIPGAYYLDLDRDLSAAPSLPLGRHPLPDAQRFAQTLCQLGVKQQQTDVVIYGESHPAFAARLWWLLRYWGHDRVQVLDGGWQAWQAGGYPTTAQTTAPRGDGQFDPQPRPHWVIDRQNLRDQLAQNAIWLVDSRDATRYLGEQEPIDPIAGHTPGAVNRPWREACETDGRLRSPQDLQAQWSELQSQPPAVVYCGSGVTACVKILALAQAGLPLPRLYPGGWSAWCAEAGDATSPLVATGPS